MRMKAASKFRLAALEPAEADIQRAIMDYLRVCKRVGFAWRNNSGAAKSSYTDARGKTKERFVRFGCKGSSDIIGWTADGRFLAIECKTSKGRITPDQREFLRKVRAAGGVAILARSVDDVVEVLG